MNSGSVLADRYRLVSLLGRGGMGEVWRAEHLGLHAPVAIKLMGPEFAASAEALQRFNREAQSAAALRSPHVVQILDHGVDPATGSPFIAMELMEGETLSHRIARVGRLNAAETARVVTHVARALSRAHEAGIVHRDLKPDNIFIVHNEDEEIAKVLDFGIAKVNAQSLSGDVATRTGAVMGTPYYMSPEQIGGSKNVDHRTDLWALGVIACECATGRRPFEADTIGGLVLAICTAPLPAPSSLGTVAPGFDAWAARALERDPQRRFQTARELADSLRALLGTAGVATGSAPMLAPAGGTGPIDAVVGTVGATARTTPGLNDTTGAKKPSRAPLWALAGLALAGVAGLSVYLLRGSEPPAPVSEGGTIGSAASGVAEPSPAPSAPVVMPEPAPSAALPSAPEMTATAVPAAPSSSAVAAPSNTANVSPPQRRVEPPARRTQPKPPPGTPSRPSAPTPKPQAPTDSSTIFDRRKG